MSDNIVRVTYTYFMREEQREEAQQDLDNGFFDSEAEMYRQLVERITLPRSGVPLAILEALQCLPSTSEVQP